MRKLYFIIVASLFMPIIPVFSQNSAYIRAYQKIMREFKKAGKFISEESYEITMNFSEGTQDYVNYEPADTLDNGTVLYVKMLKIPSDYKTVIRRFGAEYDSIADSICYGNDQLRQVEFYKTVRKIGVAAFYGCKRLQKIFVESEEPPLILDNAFAGVKNSVKVYVPAESIDLYKQSSGWCDFKNLKPIKK